MSRSGSAQYHGDVWYLGRNGALDARSFFIQRSLITVGTSSAGDRRAAYLEKEWMVFFRILRRHPAATERQHYLACADARANRRKLSGGPTIYDPFSPATDAAGNAVRTPFPNNQIPANRLNATDLKIAQKAYPAPNLQPGQIAGVNYINEGILTNNNDQFSARVDHQFGHKDNFFARYTQNTVRPVTLTLPGFGFEQDQLMKTLLASHTHMFSPTLLLTVRYGLSRRNRTRAWVDRDCRTTLGFCDISRHSTAIRSP